MPVQAREIKGRLKSIKNTSKITHTMELVAAAKMRRAVSSALDSRPYAALAWDLMSRLRDSTAITEGDSIMRFFDDVKPLKDGKNHTTIILLTSNRGLCGALNTNVLKKVIPYISNHKDEVIDVIGVGKKGVSILNSFGHKSELAYEKDDSAKDDESIRDLVVYVHKKFKDGKTGKVMVAYTDFKSAVMQNATLKQVFPFTKNDDIAAAVDNIDEKKERVEKPDVQFPYVYEPTEGIVLEYLIPRVLTSEIYQALLESNASEHSSRMIAMKNATESAAEMADELKLEFNRARQAGITQEIAEISAGSAAIS